MTMLAERSQSQREFVQGIKKKQTVRKHHYCKLKRERSLPINTTFYLQGEQQGQILCL